MELVERIQWVTRGKALSRTVLLRTPLHQHPRPQSLGASQPLENILRPLNYLQVELLCLQYLLERACVIMSSRSPKTETGTAIKHLPKNSSRWLLPLLQPLLFLLAIFLPSRDWQGPCVSYLHPGNSLVLGLLPLHEIRRASPEPLMESQAPEPSLRLGGSMWGKAWRQ